MPGLPRTALVHDYLTQIGGAERVAGVLAERLPAGTSSRPFTAKLPSPSPASAAAGGRRAISSACQLLPLKAMLPLLPGAIASLDLLAYDLIVSSSSAFAHHVPSIQRRGM